MRGGRVQEPLRYQPKNIEVTVEVKSQKVVNSQKVQMSEKLL
jgi:hypothetical protein